MTNAANTESSSASSNSAHMPFEANELTVSLTVNDLAASLAWYRDVMNFTVDKQHERGGKLIAVSFKAGTVRMLINQDNGAQGTDRIKGVGFSMMLTTTQNIDEYAGRITKNGGKLDAEPSDSPFGTRVFRLTDPNGFKFVISSVR
ncbi:MAG: VOC family protein [Gemmatimonadaceae bacterium]